MSGPRSLQRIAGERLINQLTDAVSGHQATAYFSYSGSVDVGDDILGSTTRYRDFISTKKTINSLPVIIHWDTPSDDVSRKITFLMRGGKEKVLQQLVEDCQPATFGFGGKDVLDEKIRKAGKLETRQFSTNFNPYDSGIVDAVASWSFPVAELFVTAMISITAW